MFKEDEDDGALEFLGEDSIDHTPKDKKITINTGKSFDISADKKVKNYRSYDNSGYSANISLTVTNHKSIATEIVIRYTKSHGDNLRLTWKSTGFEIKQETASKYLIKRKFAPN